MRRSKRSQEQRQAFLEQSCRDHPDLRHLVETLLQNDEKHPSFLEEPALVVESLPTGQDLTGRHVGTYRILSLLGAGGMGEVYRAHDERLGRDVAIKMLPSAFAGDAGRLARSHREARVLASLNHPNIAAIYGLEETAEGHCWCSNLSRETGRVARCRSPRQLTLPARLRERSKPRTSMGSSIGI